MFSWFTSKSVERTKAVLKDPFSVYDLTFLEWEQRTVILKKDKVFICSERPNKKTPKRFEIVFKKDRFSIYCIYRTVNKEDAERVFHSIENILNLLSEGISSNKPLTVSSILKNIVESKRTQPNWTSAHIAAKAGLDPLFIHKRDHIIANLNSQSPPDMSSPLHLVIESGRLSTTKAVLALKPKLNLKDKSGNYAIHLAAMSDKEVLQELLKDPNIMEMLKWTNEDGCTPIHLACYALKYDNIIKLLEFGLTVQMLTISKPKIKVKKSKLCHQIVRFKSEDIEDLDTEDMQYGGTPLHWVKHRRALEKFIGFGFDIDAKNALGETALHTMVKRMRLKCMIGLLCWSAKVNRTNQLKETPLHLAVKAADVTSTQALIVFDANINSKNKNGETSRHIAAQAEHPDHQMVLYLLSAIGAKRCSKDMKNCNTGCAHNGSYEGKPYHKWPSNENKTLYKEVLIEPVVRKAIEKRTEAQESKDESNANQTKGAKMICFDGGGIRGLISIQMLIEIEKRYGSSITDCFDWIAGTSTGSILALMIATQRKLKDMRGIYFRFKDKILVGSRPYSSKNFETLLEEEIGSDLRMSDVKTKFNKHLIINAVLIDRNPAKLHLFRSYESPEDILGLPHDLPALNVYPNHKEQIAWKACRASGAAPTYFRASGAFLDGGLIANNPTLDALTEFKIYNNSLKAIGRENDAKELDLVLSIGTGKFMVTPAEPIDVVHMWSFNPREIHKNTLYLKQMGNLLINQVCATEGHVTDRAQAWCSGIKAPYFRVNPVLSEVLALDETNDVEICNAMWETKAYMFAIRHKIDDILQLMSPKDQTNNPSSSLMKSPENKTIVDLRGSPKVTIISKNDNPEHSEPQLRTEETNKKTDIFGQKFQVII